MEITRIAPKLTMLNLKPPIPGFDRFIGSYVLRGAKIAIVDTGPRTAIPNLIQGLKAIDIAPQEVDYIFLTHVHIDHAGGAGIALREMGHARVIAHPRGHKHLVDPAYLWQASHKALGELAVQYGEIEAVPEDRIIDATDSMKLDLGDSLVLEIYLTPGHAAHHMSIFYRAERLLIAGEAAGICLNGDSIRPSTPVPFNLDEALSSIDRLIALEPDKLCYGHFGCYGSGLERLKLIRQKTLEWHEIVNSVARTVKDSELVLSLLRERDNDLDYLDSLSRDEYLREHLLLLNGIRGLAGQLLPPQN